VAVLRRHRGARQAGRRPGRATPGMIKDYLIQI
jgi:hypothetical protein